MSELDLPQIPLDMGIAWEYKIAFFKNGLNTAKLENELNDFGADGWEFIQFHSGYKDCGIFKRVKLKDHFTTSGA